jgi:hypothetical protein
MFGSSVLVDRFDAPQNGQPVSPGTRPPTLELSRAVSAVHRIQPPQARNFRQIAGRQLSLREAGGRETGPGSNGSRINGLLGHSIEGAVSDAGPDVAIDLQLCCCRGHYYQDCQEPYLVSACYAAAVKGLRGGGAGQ